VVLVNGAIAFLPFPPALQKKSKIIHKEFMNALPASIQAINPAGKS
jgi:hypothetical protein